ncbi:MAG TPA: sodium:proton antiporter [Acidobacteriota bacterium]|nr:sodium:proton antiporter [Acidobacteriota bacterium]
MSTPLILVDQIMIILVAGIVAAKLSERFGLPSIIPLFIIGYIVGPDVLGVFAPLSLGLSLSVLVTLAIPVILFDEGMRIDLKLLNEFKLTIFALATLAVAISTIGIGIVAFLAFNMPPLEAILMGAILAATSPAAAIAINEQFKIEKKISTIIEAEASLNDATSIVLFTIISGAALGASISLFSAISSFVILFFGGLLAGALLSLLIVFLIRRFRLEEYAFYLSLVNFLGAYAGAEALGASGATAVVASGLVLGWFFSKKSSQGIMREKLRDIWSNLAFISRSIIFLVLGAGFSLVALASVWVQAIVVTLLLFVVIRPLSVFSATFFEKKLSRKEKYFISWIGARGAVPAALAASTIGLGITGAQQIFDIVIVVVLASLIIVGFSGQRMAKFALPTFRTDEKKEEIK